jgi:hypothetical protein
MNVLDLVTSTDENGQKYFSLTELSALALLFSPVVMAWYLLLSGQSWPPFAEYCFYSIGGGVSIKATKGGVGAVDRYYQQKQANNKGAQW